MIGFFRHEIGGILQFLKTNGSETIVILSATLCLGLDRYHTIDKACI